MFGREGIVSFLKKFSPSKNPIVFSDVDNTIRWDKKVPLTKVEEGIRQFRKDGGLFIPVTGGPKGHIPKFLIDPVGLCESGAVLICKKRIKILASHEELRALKFVQSFLGVHVRDGPCRILGEYSVIIEGPRWAALTCISGKHSFYPSIETDAPMNKIEAAVQNVIKQYSLPLRFISGAGDGYVWLDITTTFKKEHAVEWFCNITGRKHLYFLGDSLNDYEAMNLPYVIPVGFKNTVSEIKELIKIRGGILVDNAGPDGGVCDALKIISEKNRTGGIHG